MSVEDPTPEAREEQQKKVNYASSRLEWVQGKLDKFSLVGTFFHSDAERAWQGIIVAEPAPTIYLIEIFDWNLGSPNCQRLVRLSEMYDWRFYDTAEWMNRAYETEIAEKWGRT